MKTILASFFALFLTIGCCYAQEEVPVTIQVSDFEMTPEELMYYAQNWSDYICVNKKVYVSAACDGFSIMITKNYLEKEIGEVQQSFNFGDDVKPDAPIFAMHWDVGTKIYKIKNVSEKNYIAVEWPDPIENKYFVYFFKINKSEQDYLEKIHNIIIKKEQKVY